MGDAYNPLIEEKSLLNDPIYSNPTEKSVMKTSQSTQNIGSARKLKSNRDREYSDSVITKEGHQKAAVVTISTPRNKLNKNKSQQFIKHEAGEEIDYKVF